MEEPERFAAVLAAWLERQTEWQESRGRFRELFEQANVYNINRLVAAANVFDIMPSSAVGLRPDLSTELDEARKACRSAFKKLPRSDERESILRALGRMRTLTLKQKIKNRARPVIEAVPKLARLETVIDEAVDCRNYYVHGPMREVAPT